MSEPYQHHTIICIGSNVAERLDIVRRAMSELEQWLRITATSEYYEFDDDSGVGKPYVNIVVAGIPLIDFETMQTNIKILERSYGRDAASKRRGVMPLDIDVVVWEGRVIDREQYMRPYFLHGLAGIR